MKSLYRSYFNIFEWGLVVVTKGNLLHLALTVILLMPFALKAEVQFLSICEKILMEQRIIEFQASEVSGVKADLDRVTRKVKEKLVEEIKLVKSQNEEKGLFDLVLLESALESLVQKFIKRTDDPYIVESDSELSWHIKDFAVSDQNIVILFADNELLCLGDILTCTGFEYAKEKIAKDNGNPTKVFAADSAFTVLTDDGKLYCWGEDSFEGGCAEANEFLKKFGAKKFVDVFSADNTFVAITDNGKLYCLGKDHFSDDCVKANEFLSEASAAAKFVDVFAADGAFVALSDSGKLYCLGEDHIYVDCRQANEFLKKTGATKFVKVYVSKFTFAAMTDKGRLYCWGKSRSAVDCSGPNEFLKSAPGAESFADVFAADRAMVAITNNGLLYCWGEPRFQDDCKKAKKFLNEAGATKFVDVVVSGNSFSALTDNGKIYCLGEIRHRDDFYKIKSFLKKASTNKHYVKVFGSDGAFVGVMNTGKIFYWGNRIYYEILRSFIKRDDRARQRQLDTGLVGFGEEFLTGKRNTDHSFGWLDHLLFEQWSQGFQNKNWLHLFLEDFENADVHIQKSSHVILKNLQSELHRSGDFEYYDGIGSTRKAYNFGEAVTPISPEGDSRFGLASLITSLPGIAIPELLESGIFGKQGYATKDLIQENDLLRNGYFLLPGLQQNVVEKLRKYKFNQNQFILLAVKGSDGDLTYYAGHFNKIDAEKISIYIPGAKKADSETGALELDLGTVYQVITNTNKPKSFLLLVWTTALSQSPKFTSPDEFFEYFLGVATHLQVKSNLKSIRGNALFKNEMQEGRLGVVFLGKEAKESLPQVIAGKVIRKYYSKSAQENLVVIQTDPLRPHALLVFPSRYIEAFLVN